jgi:hypothetical protein
MTTQDWLHLGLALCAVFLPFALGFFIAGRIRATTDDDTS